ncbi:MAG TPA: alpha-hydroxy acid oxidase [Solirubrobacterales bacterium]|jgi:isopentenyl diphosphate isomerase/L-lactate dehydrogenase-like FMN-dependent dehydrogenase
MTDGPINVADFERLAAEKLDAGTLGYFAGGAGDELALRDNVAAWQRWRLRPRVLNDVSEVTTAAELLGGPVSMPVLVAPVAYQRLLDPEGEVGMARAAAAAGTVMCLSTLATARPSEVAAAAPAGRRWFQLYPFRDATITRALTDEAVDCGFEAVVLTVDAPPGGNRERDLRTGFRIPEGLGVPSVAAAMGAERAVTIAETFELMTRSLGWDDLERLVSDCGVPVLLKGVLAPEDAELAVEQGIAGVIVSNHGGRQLDRALAPADALPEIVEAVAGRAAVLVDGGIRRGVDVVIALALGADAVLVGRAPIWGLAAAGSKGAKQVLDMLRDELELALALCRAPSPAALRRSHVLRAPATSVYSVQ